MRIFVKLFKSDGKRNIGKLFCKYSLSSFTTSSARYSEFDARNVILFQFKVFDRNIKETMLARYFIKVTARPSFMRLRVIKRTNRVY